MKTIQEQGREWAGVCRDHATTIATRVTIPAVMKRMADEIDHLQAQVASLAAEMRAEVETRAAQENIDPDRK